jgi:glycosyltransferase involved in cell wall biosynthesis
VRICFFDVASSGHHPSFRAGLASAAVDTGAEVTVASPDPHELPDIEWIHAVERGLGLGGRRQFRRISNHCRDIEAAMFVDLNFDRNVWVIPHSHANIPARRHVLHHTNQYIAEDRGTMGGLRTAGLRRFLSRLTDQGAQVIVHTQRAREVLGPIAAPNSILQFGYPIHREWILHADTHIAVDHHRPRVLFVGRARREKGLQDLLEAVARLGRDVVIQVAGPQDVAVLSSIQRSSPTVEIEWLDKFVPDVELMELFRTASIVAVPYRGVFRRHGGASGVLLQALAQAKPLITTYAVADQLPTGYGGAVIVPPDDALALAEGLEYALQRIGQLSRAAVAAGPSFVSTHHTFSGYINALFGESQNRE